MNNNFRPTRIEILKALEDEENGRKIEPNMAAYLAAADETQAISLEKQQIQQQIAIATQMAELINSTLKDLSHMPEKILAEVGKKNPRVIRLARGDKADRFNSERVKEMHKRWEEQNKE